MANSTDFHGLRARKTGADCEDDRFGDTATPRSQGFPEAYNGGIIRRRISNASPFSRRALLAVLGAAKERDGQARRLDISYCIAILNVNAEHTLHTEKGDDSSSVKRPPPKRGWLLLFGLLGGVGLIALIMVWYFMIVVRSLPPLLERRPYRSATQGNPHGCMGI